MIKKSRYIIPLFIIPLLTFVQISQCNTKIKPKFVILIVIDQFRYDYVTRYSDQYTGGLKMILDQGSFYTNAHLNYAPTHTSVGHACIATGTLPDKNGIVMNNWYERSLERVIYSCEDTTAPLWSDILDARNEKRDLTEKEKINGRSPRNLLTLTLGDAFKLSQNNQSKVYSISHKDRTAVFMGGKMSNGSFWMDKDTGEFTSSSYYGNTPPYWLNEFNKIYPLSTYFGMTWTRLLPESEYQISRPDNDPCERDIYGLGITFPHVVQGSNNKPDSSFVNAFTYTPHANEHLLKLAKYIIDQEKLGQSKVTDMLFISLSANDLVGHSFGPNSQEVQDCSLRTDRYLGDFFTYLDKTIGLKEILIFITADHGVPPIPEIMQESGYDAGRFPAKNLISVVNEKLRNTYQIDNLVINFSEPCIYLNREIIQQKGLLLKEVQMTATDAVLSIPQIQYAFTENQLLSGQYLNNEVSQRFARSCYAGRSGDIFICLKPFWFFGTPGSKGINHGTPYPYDTHVPIMILGHKIPNNQFHRLVGIEDIAPTIANILGVELSTNHQKDILYEIIR